MFYVASFPDGYLKKSHGFGKRSSGSVRLVHLKTLPKSTFVYIFAFIFFLSTTGNEPSQFHFLSTANKCDSKRLVLPITCNNADLNYFAMFCRIMSFVLLFNTIHLKHSKLKCAFYFSWKANAHWGRQCACCITTLTVKLLLS